MCHNCGAEYNSDPEYRDDTADDNSDNEPLDYENAFGVTVESQRNIYQDIQSRRSRGNNGLYEMEASDDDNVISDGSSENMNYRDEEDLEEFVVSDNHYESSVNGATSDYSSDEEQYALQAQQTVSLDSSDEEVQLERQSLGSGNDVCVLIDDEGDTIDSDDDDNAVSPPIIEELTTSSENDSAGEGPSTRMNNLSISSSNHSLLDLDTSSDDDNAGEGSSTGAINRRNKGKRVIRSISSDESDESGSSDDDDQREDDDKNNTNAMMDESKNKKEAYKTKVKKANKKRKRKGKGKAKPKKSKSN
jgi:hypothetical protein